MLEEARVVKVKVPIEPAKARSASGHVDRRRLSKTIQKEMRREFRRWHSTQAEKVLGEFKDLNRLHGIHKAPIFDTKQNKQPDREDFASLLKQVYTSEVPDLRVDNDTIRNIPCFTILELVDGLRYMANGPGM